MQSFHLTRTPPSYNLTIFNRGVKAHKQMFYSTRPSFEHVSTYELFFLWATHLVFHNNLYDVTRFKY